MDTALLGWFISGSPVIGAKISGFEFITKMILYYFHERTWYKIPFGIKYRSKNKYATAPTIENIKKQDFSISSKDRSLLMGHKSVVIWFTGLSGSGKSTLANKVAMELHQMEVHTTILDGDNTRLGLNKDLDFSQEGRQENIRRIAEAAKLMADSGLVVLASFISPFAKDRENAKEIIGKNRFIEVFVDTPLEVCMSRDVKSLYSKAKAGKIKNFTGVDSPYEAPENPDIEVVTQDLSIEDSANMIIDFILDEKQLKQDTEQKDKLLKRA
ncbi:MAG: adenylyl-sulfate kinase [Deltaproteobacteria bacterium]|nr:adenylyl-sulfate kinase [Deltaproteobacteria bacterium]